MGAGGDVGEGVRFLMPHRPGPLIPLDDAGRRRRAPDELDALIDELLPDSDDGPGWADGLLVAGGLATGAWAVVTSGPAWLLALAASAVALGCVLPVRAVWRRAADRRRTRARARIEASGLVLDVSSPSTTQLAEAYTSLLRALPAADPEVAGAALATAHAAVCEVATLCPGRSPLAEENRYVRQRADAVAAVAASLTRRARHDAPASATAVDEPRSAIVSARDELDALTGTGTVERLLELADGPDGRDGGR